MCDNYNFTYFLMQLLNYSDIPLMPLIGHKPWVCVMRTRLIKSRILYCAGVSYTTYAHSLVVV